MRTLFRGRSVSRRSFKAGDVWGQGLDWDDLSRNPEVRQLAVTATLACVDIKASSIAAMPLHEFRKVGDDREKVDPPSRIITDPSDVFSPDEWIYAGVASLTLYDQAIGLVASVDQSGHPQRVEWVDVRHVDIQPGPEGPVYSVGGVRHTRWEKGGKVVHIRRRPIPGRLDGGLSASKALGPLITIGMEGARALAETYVSGGLPFAVMSWDDKLDQTVADAVSDRYEARRRSHPGRPLIIGRGWKFETVARDNVTVDLVEVRKQINTEIAIAHSVPPELVGGDSGSMTYKNLEGLTRHLEVRTLLPVYSALENAISRLRPSGRFVRFNADATIRTSALDRARVHDAGIRAGYLSVNEVRRLEDLPPIEDGDTHLWPPYASSIAATRPEEES